MVRNDETVVGSAAAGTLEQALKRIRHCLGQLREDQIWWRPGDGLNSIGNLVLHLCGNLRQWIVSGLGGAEDTRDRPGEFSEEGPIPTRELLAQLEAVVDESRSILLGVRDEDLQQPRRIQGFELSAVEAIFDSVPHFQGHTQEIILLTRMQLGDSYQFWWTPSTAEEGAPQ